mmetsp:Transcript_13140/g.25854  ORF Transcript_13140/g.25854 Transcript_13140/m.25854 type:complete len:114 (-) Transcript_13140:197-538(-)
MDHLHTASQFTDSLLPLPLYMDAPRISLPPRRSKLTFPLIQSLYRTVVFIPALDRESNVTGSSNLVAQWGIQAERASERTKALRPTRAPLFSSRLFSSLDHADRHAALRQTGA